jgi:hypothetical protein
MEQKEYDELEYRVWKWLETLHVGDKKSISKVKNLSDFIKAIKSYIDHNGCHIELSSDERFVKRVRSVDEFDAYLVSRGLNPKSKIIMLLRYD